MTRRNRDAYTDPVRQAGRRLAELAGDADWRAYERDVRMLVDRTELPADQVEKVLRELGMWDVSPMPDDARDVSNRVAVERTDALRAREAER